MFAKEGGRGRGRDPDLMNFAKQPSTIEAPSPKERERERDVFGLRVKF